MDHDLLFKQVLTTFFYEFLESFLPAVAAYVDRNSIEFLDKETFPAGLRKRISDLVVKAKFRGRDVFFLILVEHLSTPHAGFPKRIFRYFAGLSDKYDLDVYPIVIFSHNSPTKAEPHTYAVEFPNKTVLKFDYDVIQLNKLPWRRFINQPNPAATAMMAKMSIAPKDRPRVKAECLRLIMTLKLDADKNELIYSFVESYLKLTAQETIIYDEELSKLGPDVKETVMEFISSHRREGRHEGKEELLKLLLERRFGALPTSISKRMDRLTSEQLNDFGKSSMFELSSLADLERWLDANLPN